MKLPVALKSLTEQDGYLKKGKLYPVVRSTKHAANFFTLNIIIEKGHTFEYTFRDGYLPYAPDMQCIYETPVDKRVLLLA